MGNLRQMGVALSLYIGEHNGIFPMLAAGRAAISQQDVQVIDNTLNRYLTDSRVFACPADGKGLAASTGTSYYWDTVLNNQPVGHLVFLGIADPTRIPVLSDKEGFHPYIQNKVNILYADGHAGKDLNFYTRP